MAIKLGYMKIYVNYCFNDDVKVGQDPDKLSQKLAIHHQILWSKKTASGNDLKFTPSFENGAYRLHYLVNGIDKIATSDCIANSHIENNKSKKYTEYREKMKKELPGKEEEYERIGRTIGGHIIFPGIVEPGANRTINVIRGLVMKDRIDLTLEAIKRFYDDSEDKNPLINVLNATKYFYDLFGSFKNFIDFFLLNDYVDDNYNVKFLLPFSGSFSDAHYEPRNYDECKILTIKTIELCKKRNDRIFNFCISNNIPVEKFSQD